MLNFEALSVVAKRNLDLGSQATARFCYAPQGHVGVLLSQKELDLLLMVRRRILPVRRRYCGVLFLQLQVWRPLQKLLHNPYALTKGDD